MLLHMEKLDRELFLNQAERLEVTLDSQMLDCFELAANMLIEWNKKINLTAITDMNEIVIKHFVDSLTISSLLPKTSCSLIDVGTGAGFPGVPLGIVRKDIKITLLDSLNKRVVFLKALCKDLGLKADIVHGRAELAGRNNLMREKFDVATARAVASLPVLCEYCVPFVRIGGRFIAMKGPTGETEVETAQEAVSILGAKYSFTDHHNIGVQREINRSLLVYDKIKHTPPQYPRMHSKIKKQPL